MQGLDGGMQKYRLNCLANCSRVVASGIMQAPGEMPARRELRRTWLALLFMNIFIAGMTLSVPFSSAKEGCKVATNSQKAGTCAKRTVGHVCTPSLGCRQSDCKGLAYDLRNGSIHDSIAAGNTVA